MACGKHQHAPVVTDAEVALFAPGGVHDDLCGRTVASVHAPRDEVPAAAMSSIKTFTMEGSTEKNEEPLAEGSPQGLKESHAASASTSMTASASRTRSGVWEIKNSRE